MEFLQSKMLLPTYDVFDEMRNFAPARSQELFDFCGNRMALTICEDAWNDKDFWNKRLYGTDPIEALIRSGGNFVLNISASPFWLGKRELRTNMLATIARNDHVPVVMVNQVGGNDSLLFDGSSLVINREGKVIAQGKSFEEDMVYFDSATLDRRTPRTSARRRRQRLPCPCAGHARLRSQMRIPEGRHRTERRHRLRADGGDRDGRRWRRERHRCWHARAILVAGIDRRRARARHKPRHSLRIAAYRRHLRQLQRDPEAVYSPDCKEDVTEENIQARARGSLLMALSNKFNAIVLSHRQQE